jgi:hypothetical protein
VTASVRLAEHVDDERMGPRPALHVEHTLDRRRVERTSAEAINRFGRKNDHSPVTELRGCFGDGVRIRMLGIDGENAHGEGLAEDPWAVLACAAMRALVWSALYVVVLVRCGGPSGSKTPVAQPSDAGADAALPVHVVSTLPTDVKNPPPFNLGSKHAQRREHTEWRACRASFHPTGDPTKAVAALATACSSATKMHAANAPPMGGTQNAISSQPITYKFHGAAKHCYRLYAAVDSKVKSLVAVVADAEGAEIAEYHTDEVTPFIAPDEALCFSDDSDAQVTVSVGIGDGAYAVSLWSD